jgi:hypothetical protein
MSYYHQFLPGEGGYLLDLLLNVSKIFACITYSFIAAQCILCCVCVTYSHSLSWALHDDFYDTSPLQQDKSGFFSLRQP